MKTIAVLMATLFLATAVVTVRVQNSAAESEKGDAHRLVVLPAGASEYREYRINTRRKALQKDGTLNDVYVTKRPSRGKVFVTVILHVSAGDRIRVTREDIILKNLRSGSTNSYIPFDWFIEDGAGERRGGEQAINDKAIVNATFEIPLAHRDELVLHFMTDTVGALGSLKRGGPAYL